MTEENQNWVVVFSSGTEHEASLINGLLNEAGIEAVIVNKKDSLYLIGEVEVYVKTEDALQARQIINPGTHE